MIALRCIFGTHYAEVERPDGTVIRVACRDGSRAAAREALKRAADSAREHARILTVDADQIDADLGRML